MPLLLCIETSSINCSTALFNGSDLLAVCETAEVNAHSARLHPFIMNVLEDAGKKFPDLDGIVLGSGPGSFTGLRIGASAAKALCFALSIPLMSVSSLKLMASIGLSTLDQEDNIVLCPAIDARRNEIYYAAYDRKLEVIQTETSTELEKTTFSSLSPGSRLVFCGDGAGKAKAVIEDSRDCLFIDGVYPAAPAMGRLAADKFRMGEFEDLTSFEPMYIKSFHVTGRKKSG
jgi:tRNA threonylcarbamoyladenosine biosynthesis protein TsaB